MRLHLIGLPHAQTIDKITVCAFTTKLIKFCEMMQPLGYEIFLYSGDKNDAKVSKHIQIYSKKEQKQWFGNFDQNKLPTIATWNVHDKHWYITNQRAIESIRLLRESNKDIICLLAGWAQQPIADAFPDMISCEWAAGYEGWFFDYVCFESYAWMHHCYGKRNINDGRWFDTVIPNFFRPEDFSIALIKENYLLFVGRLINRKGLRIAHDIARHSDIPLIIAGSGAKSYKNKLLITKDEEQYDNVEYIGTIGTRQRNELMSKARVLIAPTTYIEPFGAVAVEAQLCGTPVITTDWGAFSETVEQDISGFRIRTLKEGLSAVEKANKLDPVKIRNLALDKYSLEKVGPMYDQWFKQLNSLWNEGWYEI